MRLSLGPQNEHLQVDLLTRHQLDVVLAFQAVVQFVLEEVLAVDFALRVFSHFVRVLQDRDAGVAGERHRR